MRRSEDADVLARRLHAERIEETVIVVGHAVLPMHGGVELVRAFDEVERIDREGHEAFASQFAWRAALDGGIRAVTADALDVEDADAECEVAEPLVRAYVQADLDTFARLKQMRGLPARASHLDVGNFRFTVAPTSFFRF